MMPSERRRQSGVRPSGQRLTPAKHAQLGAAVQGPKEAQLLVRGAVQPRAPPSWQASLGAAQVVEVWAAQEEVGTAKQSSAWPQWIGPQATPGWPASTVASAK